MEKKRSSVALDRGIFNLFSSRRAQVTIFIILGILLLLAMVLIYTVKTEVITFKPEELPAFQKGNVEDYLSACILQLGEEAIFKIGQQGGYLELPPEIAGDAGQHLATSPLTAVPFWAHGNQQTIPPLTDIKLRIDNYIKDNLRNCVFQFIPFTKQYDFVEKSPITANTEIVENKVIFNVNWDIDIRNKAGEMITETANHVAESKIRLKKTYDTAKLITEKEMAELKLEDITQDLLALEHPQVPLSGIEMSCDKKEWNVKETEKTLLEMLHVNLGELQIKGTDIIEYPSELPYYQSHYLWDLGEDFRQPQISAFFQFDNYTQYPYYFSVTPRSGDKLVSNEVKGSEMISFFCMQNWKFNYDLTYPVVVNVRDETTGYNFRMGMTVHLKRNFPDRQGIASASPAFTLSKSLTYDSTQFCQDIRVPLILNTYKIVQNHHTGIYFRDPLEGVNLSFSCLRYKCPLGGSEYDYLGKGDVAGKSTIVPYCAGAIVRGEKESYKEDWMRIVSEPNQEVELDLVPLYRFPAHKIKVVKHDFTSPQLIGTAVPLSKEEWATIKIYFDDKLINENLPSIATGEEENPNLENLSEDQSTVVTSETNFNLPINYQSLSGSGISTHTHESFLTLSPQADDLILSAQNLEFLAEADFTYAVEVNVFKQDSEEGQWIGGYKYNWTVPWDRLYGAQEIIFHILSTTDASETGLLEFMNNLGENSRYIFLPEIK
ncbi:MAG: hypothetical protein V2A62_05230 [Candidatus Woesearchaeota archaeon]